MGSAIPQRATGEQLSAPLGGIAFALGSCILCNAKSGKMMRDYDKALADIEEIRSRMAASTTFRGFGPAALAATGVLALGAAAVESAWLPAPLSTPLAFYGGWIATALVSIGLIGTEMVVRSRRHHGGLADAMIHNAVQQVLPAGAAGAAVAAILARFAPSEIWMLPGIWEILVSLGLFAAVPSLPRGTIIAAAWYFLAGCVVLMLAANGPTLSAWMMGVPFAVGQLVMAAVVLKSSGGADAD